MLQALLGGRPMRIINMLFVDRVTRKSVYLVEDRYGRRWMAEGRWSLFRVEHGSH